MKIVNRRARYEYQIIKEYDAGIVLTGGEVKSIRLGNANIKESYIWIRNNEVWIKNMYVSKYKQEHHLIKHDEMREKKLLLNKDEIKKIKKSIQEKGTTCVPLEIFLSNNRLKVKIAVAKGKKIHDKKESIKNRDIKMDLKRNNNIKI